MADKQFQMKIITPTKVVFDEPIKYLLINTGNGQKGILAGHESCLDIVEKGDFKVVTEKEELIFTTSGGTFYLVDDKATITAEITALASEYDRLMKERIEELSRRYSEEIKSELELKQMNLALRRSLMRKN